MNKTLQATPFGTIPLASRDPILGINEAFNADKNPDKINLGVGVYYDDNGRVPLLDSVRQAEAQLMVKAAPRTYLPIDGLAAYDRVVQHMVFGASSASVSEKRVVTVQSIGGTGALKIGADFIKRFSPSSQVWISDPSWENHRALFEAAGFKVNTYPYFDAARHGIDFAGMMGTLESMPSGSVVLLHACCHNPTGADLTDDQWSEVISVVNERGLVPFLDMAYQGFADGIDADGRAVRRFAEAGGPVLVSNSFSKSFSLYGERVGAFSFVGSSEDEAGRVLSQLKRVVRTNYSNPPLHGAQIVATVLGDADLNRKWEEDLAAMRVRIREMRHLLVDKLHAKQPARNFDFVIRQNGMFSYSGLTQQQVERLRNEFSVYAVDTGRICVAALNTRNIDRVVEAISSVI
jgi:aromatic-amino-acid transaminase